MKLKCYAIDDEPLALELISDNAKRIDFLDYVGGNTSATKGLDFLLNNKVDLLFLDIQMPKLTGVELARQIPESTLVIFTTAYDEYAVTGFELNAVDYVLKPIDFFRFEKACNKSLEVAEWRLGKEKEKYIFINAEHTLVRILLYDVLYIEGLKDYVKIFLIPPHLTSKISLLPM